MFQLTNLSQAGWGSYNSSLHGSMTVGTKSITAATPTPLTVNSLESILKDSLNWEFVYLGRMIPHT